MYERIFVVVVAWLCILARSAGAIYAEFINEIAPEDVRAFQKIRKTTGVKIWRDCSNLEDMCSSCPNRIKCERDSLTNLQRISEIRLNNASLSGTLPVDLFSESGALSRLRTLDVSLNSRLDVSKCVPYDRMCARGMCAPHLISCSDRRSLQSDEIVLSDPAELAAWQTFYDAAGGDQWVTCGGRAARANPCNPNICRSGDIDRYVVCALMDGKITILEIKMVENNMRGFLADTALAQMLNLRLIWITNADPVNATTPNILFNENCVNLQRCYIRGEVVCNFEFTGLNLCNQIPTSGPTRSPTLRPTTLAPTTKSPTSKAPTSKAPTLNPTTKSPTTGSPTSKAPTRLPTNSPTRKQTSSPVTPSKSPTKVTTSPTIAPTKYPTRQPTVARLPQQDYDAWANIFRVLNGNGWDFCDHSNADPCNFPTTGCEWHTRISCRAVADGTLRITEVYLPMNNMRGVLPEDDFNVIGKNLEVLDVSENQITMAGQCVNLDFCYGPAKCNLALTGLTLCPKGSKTLAPTIYKPLAADELAAWQKLYDMLDGPNWSDGCNQARNDPCFHFQCVQCIVVQNEVRIHSIFLNNKNLRGFLDDIVFWSFRFLKYLDLSDNGNRISSDDCIRAETCYAVDTFCDFSNSGVELCKDSLNTLAPALGTRPELTFPDLVAFYWIYDELNGRGWNVPTSCKTTLDYDPCSCPSRIRCVMNPSDSTQLIIQGIVLEGANVNGIIPILPFERLFERGLYDVDLSGPGNQLRTADGSCLNLAACYDGRARCDFVNSGVALCSPPPGSPPTVAPSAPTRMPTYNTENPCRTTGGLAKEGTPCASPFRYSGTPFSSCISFQDRPPLSTDPFDPPRVPTDMWCPTVDLYNLETKNDWGFCDCTSLAPTTTFQTKPPFSFFSLAPTRTPTTLQPTRPPTLRTSSPTKSGATLQPTKTPTTSPPTKAPTATNSPTAQPTTLAPTNTPTTGAPTKAPTSASPTKAPTQGPTASVPPTTRSPTTTKSPTTTNSPTIATKNPTSGTNSPTTTKSPASGPTSSTFAPSKAPTRAPTGPTTTNSPTLAPVMVLPDAELAQWRTFFNSLNGPSWTACSQSFDNPCACQGRQGVFVKCSVIGNSGRRRRQLQEEEAHITEINLPNNNVQGTLPTSAVQQMPQLSMLNLEGNPVVLPDGADCADLAICTRNCKIGSICDSEKSLAPTSPRGGDGGSDATGIIVAVVIILLALLLLLLLCCMHRQCPERLPAACNRWCGKCSGKDMGDATSSSRGKLDGGDSLNTFLVTRDDEEDAEYGDPAFKRLAEQVNDRPIPSRDQQRPDGRSHFSWMKSEALPQLKDNSTLSEAKLDAMKLDDAARMDVGSLDELLENIGLGHRVEAFKYAGVTTIDSFMKLKDPQMREIGLTLGDRVKVKRTIDIRAGLINDPVFGKTG